MKAIERLRWRIAELIDRLPGQCWSGLADWPLGTRRWPWAPISDMCREDAARCGGCYCGKFRRDLQARNDARRRRWSRRITWSLVAATALVWTAALIAMAVAR